jgi:hypothetical protein
MNRHTIISTLVAVILVLLFAADSLAQSQDRARLEREIASLMQQLRDKEKEFLAPSSEDRAAFAEFLRQPGTGLIRLLPREVYQDKLVTSIGGSSYSFVRLTHDYGQGTDIELDRDKFLVGLSGASFGYFANLGDVPLDAVALGHAALRPIVFEPPSKLHEARTQQMRAHNGFEAEGFNYKREVPAREDTTYVLRSINYGRYDVLVAFRVVRRDLDGSLTILYKTLKKFPMPELARN